MIAELTTALALATPATDGMLHAAVAGADGYWRGRGYDPPAASIWIYREPAGTGVIERAPLHSGIVYFDAGYVRAQRRWLAKGTRAQRRATLAAVCTIAAHARGHNLGLEHARSGVMRPGPRTIGHCRRWAARLAR